MLRLRSVLVQEQGKPPPEYFEDAKLEAAAKWAAGGFTLLAALLTFFGIKEGILDRLLRSEPERAMLVFALLGVGVVCSLLGPAFKAGNKIKAWSVVVAIALIGLVLTLAAWTDSTTLAKQLSLGAVAFVLLAAWLLRGALISVVAAVICVGVAATAMGLHSAASLAVDAKAGGDEPRVTAAIERANGVEAVRVTMRAARVERREFLVRVHGAQGAASVLLAEARLVPDGVGDVTETMDVPVVLARWDEVRVSFCEMGDAAGGANERVCGAERRAVTLRPERGAPRVAARIVPGTKPGTADVAVDVKNVPLDASVDVRVVVRRGGTERAQHVARLVDGAATWAPGVRGLKAGDVVSVTYALCAPTCAARRVPVAAYTAR